jgi:hypothetical protein
MNTSKFLQASKNPFKSTNIRACIRLPTDVYRRNKMALLAISYPSVAVSCFSMNLPQLVIIPKIDVPRKYNNMVCTPGISGSLGNNNNNNNV